MLVVVGVGVALGVVVGVLLLAAALLYMRRYVFDNCPFIIQSIAFTKN
jgi:hypothetical protein